MNLLQRKKILLLEDDLILGMLTETMLGEIGMDLVATLQSGEEAPDAVARLQPDIILMDIQLKGLWDGIETAQAIRRISDKPIIFLTGNSDAKTTEKIKAVPNATLLLKPVKENELALACRESLSY
ncbi:Response regulator receiver domain-containing protein [Catalinimonas alkaloidigena]|uniref:Response regulator receiver domain-containing protein n=1 Tax=Catalinimonas alkaloidigena TaxID=1075417 RepID=A0A1G8Y2K1_9BACT|nr:response regulator [Catalinimonas alkaloidigena]SDJ96917.1 Response regulator receiver domain-containing protein [Catalinimonas alkaloidigena]